jgi:hypothetical protein
MNVEVLGDDVYYGAALPVTKLVKNISGAVSIRRRAAKGIRVGLPALVNDSGYGKTKPSPWANLKIPFATPAVIPSAAVKIPRPGAMNPVAVPDVARYTPLTYGIVRASSAVPSKNDKSVQFRQYLEKMRQRALLGDDVVYGGAWDVLTKGVTDFFKSDTGKVVTQAVTSSIGQRLTPTQKASLANLNEQMGITPMPGQYPPLPFPSQGFDWQKNAPYLIAGGAALVGLLIVVGTSKRR